MNVLVTGIGDSAGQNVTTLLLEAGHVVTGADMCPVQMFGLKEIHQSPPANDASYPEWLIAMATRVDYLIPTVQDELPTLAAVRDMLACPALIGPRDAVRIAHDKFLTAEALAAAKIPTPSFAVPSSFDATQINWPCVSKPRIGCGGRNVAVHDTPEEFANASHLTDEYIVQRYMPGIEYSVNLFLFEDPHDAELNRVSVLQKLGLRDGRTGDAGAVELVSAFDVAAVALAAAQAIGLSGPIDMDVRRDEDGVPTVLDINARFGANIRHTPQVFDATLELLSRSRLLRGRDAW